MAIREFSPEAARAKIAFIGHLPVEQRGRFEERNFRLEETTLDQLRDTSYASTLDAVLLFQDANRLNALPRELGSIVPGLLDQDVRVYVRLAADAAQTDTPRRLVVSALRAAEIPVANLRQDEWEIIPENRRERENSFLAPCAYVFDTASTLPEAEQDRAWAAIATQVCDYPAGPAPTANLRFDEELLVKRFGVDGHAERLMLLKRAFWNCVDLQLTPLAGGMSGAPAFKAYASRRDGLVPAGPSGPYPHLYFVKIGTRKKIVDEYDKYCGHIFEYVPFHLGPRLRRDRCNLGSTQGVLVSDFVEGAESLITAARGSRCDHALANLFGTTLGGWRKQARVDDGQTLGAHLRKKWLVEGSNQSITLPHPRGDIVRRLGGASAIAPLRKKFEKRAATRPLIAPAHGDMHATNVLVRHGDAILIDFEKLEANYPLTYDPASLEGGLLVEGFIDDFKNKKLDPESLAKLVQPLYEREAFKSGTVTHCRPGDHAEWYFKAVNQIRTQSWSSENEAGQYALTLAVCLIRKGCNTHENLNADAESAARAVAFFFGQKLLREFGACRPRSLPASPTAREA